MNCARRLRLNYRKVKSKVRKTSTPAVWQQRMGRREEAWESTRKAIFELVVKGEGLPDNNVLIYYQGVK